MTVAELQQEVDRRSATLRALYQEEESARQIGATQKAKRLHQDRLVAESKYGKAYKALCKARPKVAEMSKSEEWQLLRRKVVA